MLSKAYLAAVHVLMLLRSQHRVEQALTSCKPNLLSKGPDVSSNSVTAIGES